ncbi:MAG: hypothetical protein GY815_05110 [Gammaproteobacteria bacterium]|nr:hypothetical protein [Gammaproteobacteria bacterium]
MVFGGWVTLVFLMLMQEFRSRRRVGAAMTQRSSAPAPLLMHAAFQDPKLAAAATATDQPPFSDGSEIKVEPEIEDEAENKDEPENSHLEVESSEPPVAAESDQPRVERGPARRATARPELPDFNLGAVEDASGLFSTDVDLHGDGIDAALNEITPGGDEINLELSEEEMAPDGEEINLEFSEDEIAPDGRTTREHRA